MAMISATPTMTGSACDHAGLGIILQDHDGDGCPDATMAHFVRALLPSEQAEEVLNGFYTDAFHASLLNRLAALRETTAPDARRRVSPLPKWKLRQVEAHVDANIGERITLADMAAAVRLSEMHFAAQFKLATGQRPHDYVVHRRIQEARRMLAETREPIVQVALAVGFQTQAHFTTVFKKVVGATPHRWRQAALEQRAQERSIVAVSERPVAGRDDWSSFPGMGHMPGRPAVQDARFAGG